MPSSVPPTAVVRSVRDGGPDRRCAACALCGPQSDTKDFEVTYLGKELDALSKRLESARTERATLQSTLAAFNNALPEFKKFVDDKKAAEPKTVTPAAATTAATGAATTPTKDAAARK